jgi:undecaprenyl diphosphate synthase
MNNELIIMNTVSEKLPARRAGHDQAQLRRATAQRLGLTVKQMPRHIAIIMDGNGRWAQKKALPRVEGHRQGAKTAEKIAKYCVEFGIESLTLYSFSMENWKRPKAEVGALMHLYTQYLIAIRPTLMKNNVRLVHLGQLSGPDGGEAALETAHGGELDQAQGFALPLILRKELIKTMKITSNNTGMILALALNYSGRAEIVDATRSIAGKYKKGLLRLKDIDEKCLSRHLYTSGLSDPDLLIRTANEMRVSNFLLWQISYSEFYVTKILWPDFKRSSLEKAILAYAKRERRFGKLKTQN